MFNQFRYLTQQLDHSTKKGAILAHKYLNPEISLYLRQTIFDRRHHLTIAMSFAPKDELEAQIQFAFERGIPVFLSVIGTLKLAFPDKVFDLIHCALCRVHWDADGS